MPITLTGTNFTSDYYPSGQPELLVFFDAGDGWAAGVVGRSEAGQTTYISDPVGGNAFGLTVVNLVVVNSTTLTFDLVISQTAPPGNRNLRVSHMVGLSPEGEIYFQVGYPSDFLVFFG